MKKLGCILLAVAFMCLTTASLAEDPAMNGYISDAKCASKGGSAAHADCAKKCAGAGEKLVFVSDTDKKVLNVDNQDALKGHEGHHVAVTGKVENGTLHVDKVSMLQDPAK
jgi:hypothetical protein